MRDALALVGDCRAIPLPDGSVDAVVTDPPYGLAFMGKSWDHDVPGPDYWREVYRVMKPGAHLLAFGGTRTWHWLTVGIEEAGFEIRDCVSWMYGTGFPKSDALLKPAWEPVVMAWKDGGEGVVPLNIDGCRLSTTPQERQWMRETSHPNGTKAGGDGGSVLMQYDKPDGFEPNTGGRWPANVTLSHTRWCRRVGTKRVEGDGRFPARLSDSRMYGQVRAGEQAEREMADEDGKEEVEDWSCPPSCPVRMLDEQSGEARSSGGVNEAGRFGSNIYGHFAAGDPGDGAGGYGDIGGASRFYYCAKASRGEREAGLPDVDGRANRHPTVKPIDLCRWLARLVTRPGHLVLDPFMGSGSIGCAALIERRRYVGLDLNPEYVEIAKARLEHWTPKQVDLFLDTEAA